MTPGVLQRRRVRLTVAAAAVAMAVALTALASRDDAGSARSNDALSASIGASNRCASADGIALVDPEQTARLRAMIAAPGFELHDPTEILRAEVSTDLTSPVVIWNSEPSPLERLRRALRSLRDTVVTLTPHAAPVSPAAQVVLDPESCNQ